MSGLPDADAVLVALAAKADAFRTALAAKVDANLAGGVLQTRSGALRGSIRSALESDAASITITLESNGVVYAGIQEYGGRTAAHDIVATKARALRFAGAGGPGFAKRVHHPGSTIPARSYLGAALADLEAAIRDGLKSAILGALTTQ
jgi:phage gpG-like protein